MRENMKVVHCNKDKYDVYIGRGRCPKTGLKSKWGNPYEIGKDGTRKEVIQKYRNYVLRNKYLLSHLDELKDKVLGCYCAPKA